MGKVHARGCAHAGVNVSRGWTKFTRVDEGHMILLNVQYTVTGAVHVHVLNEDG